MKWQHLKQYWWLLGMMVWLVACLTDSAVDANVLFHDEFTAGQTGAWVLEGDALGRTSILDEHLLIEISEPYTLQFATLEDPIFNDFDLTVEATILEGDLRSSFGVLFRMQDMEQFYRFELTGDGLYMIERRNADGSWTRLIDDWTQSPAINQGLASPNQLRIIAAGPTLSFYANGILLQTVQDAHYKAGAVGLDAGTFSQGALRVAFDNVAIQRLGG